MAVPPIGSRRIRGGTAPPAARAPMSEINVTPFVDVMLVLLIVFMVAAPLLTVGRADRPAGDRRPSRSPSTRSRSRSPSIPTARSSCRRRRGRRSTSSCRKLHGDRRRTASTSASTCAATRRPTTARSCSVMGTINGAGFQHIGLVALEGAGQLSRCAPGSPSRSSSIAVLLAWGLFALPIAGRSTRADRGAAGRSRDARRH